MLGLIDDYTKTMTSFFKNEGDLIFLLGNDKFEIGGSEYLSVIHKLLTGDAPDIDLDKEYRIQNTILELIDNNLINSAHDTAEGGLAVALAECCIMDKKNPIGCNINYNFLERKDFGFFSESQSRIIISANKINKSGISNISKK